MSDASEFKCCEGCFDEMCGQIKQCVGAIHEEALAAEEAYRKNGVCSSCGACSAKDAETKCRPMQYPSGEWSCAGDNLWLDDEEVTEI